MKNQYGPYSKPRGRSKTTDWKFWTRIFGPEVFENSTRNSLNLKIPYSLSHSDFEKTENERL